MKHIILTIALLAPAAYAQPLKKGSIVLDVRNEQIVRNETAWRTAWGSFSRDCINSRVLEIKLRQLGPGTPSVHVRWYFIGRDYDAERLYIYDSGETSGRIAPGGSTIAPISKELILNRSQTRLRGRRTTGKHPWGWAVFVYQSDRLLAATASVPELVNWTTEEIRENAPPRKSPNRPVQFVSDFSIR